METAKPIRILVAKLGLDGHDRGAKIVTRALRDAGMEVIYTGIRQTVETIASVAVEEDVDAIGLSLLSGGHLEMVPEIIERLNLEDMGEVLIVVGGIIPPADHNALKELGVSAVFGPGTDTQAIVDFIKNRLYRSEKS
ncbi:MAG: methylmalonyl-CoA mutase [Dehalococcoidia bacterium]|nr:methylmalonyl-CoA mutase [Dehalococcoidia bacterium]|tara:strand:- start:19 stop:432 length:414 start_codon:yes stop_codon:yes gene_type:complete